MNSLISHIREAIQDGGKDSTLFKETVKVGETFFAEKKARNPKEKRRGRCDNNQHLPGMLDRRLLDFYKAGNICPS
jgi:hypothetical protein